MVFGLRERERERERKGNPEKWEGVGAKRNEPNVKERDLWVSTCFPRVEVTMVLLLCCAVPSHCHILEL